MTYWPKTKIETADSPSVDAFGRFRISSPVTLFDSKQLFDSQDLFWSTKIVSGSTSVHSPFRASTTLTTAASSGSLCIRQTKQRNYYQPGKSLQVFMTFVMGSGVPGARKKLGYFDGENGVYLEQSGSELNMVLASTTTGTPVEIRISQSAWNLDTLDGQGTSGFILDSTKMQIFTTDYQWLGSGRVRAGFSISGSTVYVHEFNHSNRIDSVYMSTPNLPLRYEVESFGATTSASLEHICTSVISEGGFEPKGTIRGIDRGMTPLSSSSGTTPVLSIRLDPAYIGTIITPSNFSIISTTNDDFRWGLYLNPIISGSDNAIWISLSGSAVQYDISRNANNNLSEGILLKSGYVPAGQGAAASNSVQDDINSSFFLGSDIDGNTDELILAVENVDAGSKNYFGSLGWRELA